MIPSPFAARLRAANDRLRELRDRLAEQVAALQAEAFDARLAALDVSDLQPGGVVFFPWLDHYPDTSPLPRPGDPGFGIHGESPQVGEDSGSGLPGDSSMIEFEPLSDSGGGGGGGF